MENTNDRVNMKDMGTIIFNWNNFDNRSDHIGPYFPRKNQEAAPRESWGSMARIEDMTQNMLRRFDVTDKNFKETRSNLSDIGQKMDAHAVSIKHLELQMTQLSTVVNPRQPDTLLRKN